MQHQWAVRPAVMSARRAVPPLSTGTHSMVCRCPKSVVAVKDGTVQQQQAGAQDVAAAERGSGQPRRRQQCAPPITPAYAARCATINGMVPMAPDDAPAAGGSAREPEPLHRGSSRVPLPEPPDHKQTLADRQPIPRNTAALDARPCRPSAAPACRQRWHLPPCCSSAPVHTAPASCARTMTILMKSPRALQ